MTKITSKQIAEKNLQFTLSPPGFLGTWPITHNGCTILGQIRCFDSRYWLDCGDDLETQTSVVTHHQAPLHRIDMNR